MCFSASASFGAGIVLTVVGVASIKKTHHPSQLPFASIPLLFGVQQIAEGVLWLTLQNHNNTDIQDSAKFIYLFFAQVLWPIWVPIAILLLEKSTTRRSIQNVLVASGVVVGCYLAYCLFTFNVEAKIVGHHIAYVQDFPFSLKNYGIILYASATIAPPFFSHLKRMWLFGLAVLTSYAISAFFYDHYVLSVWCFFASIISVSIYAIMIVISNTERNRLSQKRNFIVA